MDAARYRLFREVGRDTFFLASGTGNMMLTCDSAIVRETLSRSQDFHAPVETLALYDLYGPTLASSEGERWRLYRKISTPFFNSKTHKVIWNESMQLVHNFCEQRFKSGTVIQDIKGQFTSKINLCVISKLFFGEDLEQRHGIIASDDIPDGHSMTFSQSINTVLANLTTLFGIPRWVLAKSPFETHKEAYMGYIEWGKYMQEMRDSARSRIDTIKNSDSLNFLEFLTLSSLPESKLPDARQLGEEEVFGNIFFYFMAGFDTTSTTLSFIFLLLALHPEHQLKLQNFLDSVLGDRKDSEWTVEEDFPQLLNGYLGAVMNEALRLYHPAAWFARKAVRATQVTDSQGEVHSIPEGTTCIFDMAALGCSPTEWPSPDGGLQELEGKLPALCFNPDRWIDKQQHPPQAFIPFSIGHRACPGRRFAEVEICAMIARFFTHFSVELVPHEADLKEAAASGRGQPWIEERTRARSADHLFNGLGFGHGIYPKYHVPLKIVSRHV